MPFSSLTGRPKPPELNFRSAQWKFSLSPGDIFELTLVSFVDSYGKIPMAKMYIKGQLEWKGSHPIADGG
jgi:hypothetical protein